MQNIIYWRLVWKEWRQQRALLTTLSVGLLAGFLLERYVSIVVTEQGASSNGTQEMVLSFLLFLAFVYALGCGCTLFAAENENETVPWLSSLPQLASHVFWAKLSVAVLSCVLFSFSVYLLVGLYDYRVRQAVGFNYDPLSWSAMVLEVLAWSVFCSIKTKKVLTAAGYAGMGVALSSVIGAIILQCVSLGPVYDLIVINLVRGGTIAAIAYGCYLSRDHWWQESAAANSSPGWLGKRVKTFMNQWNSPVWIRLLWQELRSSFSFMVCIYIAFLFGIVIFRNSVLVWKLGSLLPAVLGGCTFLFDHQRQAQRFFSEKGVSARTIWLARTGFWFAATAPGFMITCLYLQTQPLTPATATPGSVASLEQNPSNLVTLYLLGFSLGQCISLLVRFGLLAPCLAVMMHYLAIAGIPYTRFAGFPDWLAIYPLIALVLGYSWLRAPDWFNERFRWRTYLQPVKYLLAPVLVYGCGLAWHRAYEIPYVPSPLPAPHLTLAQVQQLSLREYPYRDAYLEIMTPPTQAQIAAAKEWEELMQKTYPLLVEDSYEYWYNTGHGEKMKEALDEHLTQLEPLLERWKLLAENPDLDLRKMFSAKLLKKQREGYSQDVRFHVVPQVAYLLEMQGKRSEQEGKLPAALEYYVASQKIGFHFFSSVYGEVLYWTVGYLHHSRAEECLFAWANHPAQTTEFIQQGATRFPSTFQYNVGMRVAKLNLNRLKSYMRESQQYSNHALFDNPLTIGEFHDTSHYTLSQRLIASLPWEQTRASRLHAYRFMYSNAVTKGPVYVDPSFNAWINNTYLVSIFPAYYGQPLRYFTREEERSLKEYALFQIRLRFAAFRAEHKRLPNSLEEIEHYETEKYPVSQGSVMGAFTTYRWEYFPTGSKYQMYLHRGSEDYETFISGAPRSVSTQHTAFIWEPREEIRKLEVEVDSDPTTGAVTTVPRWFVLDMDRTTGEYKIDRIQIPIENKRKLRESYGTGYSLGPANEPQE
jgi:hypothetical protein